MKPISNGFPARSSRSSKRSQHFSRTCKCLQHNVYSCLSQNTKLFTIATSHEYSRTALKWLIYHGKISFAAQTVCAACLDYAKTRLSQFPPQSPNDSSSLIDPETLIVEDNVESDAVDIVVKRLRDRTISTEDAKKLSTAISITIQRSSLKRVHLGPFPHYLQTARHLLNNVFQYLFRS